ncbi:MAG: hypothetical protein ACR2RE_16690 [Geminicoccaceae bacterium]
MIGWYHITEFIMVWALSGLFLPQGLRQKSADFDEKVRDARNSPRGSEIGSVEGHFLESNFSQGSFEECHSNKFPHQVFVRTFSSVSAKTGH